MRFWIILFLLFILLPFNYIMADNKLKAPVVTAAFLMPGRFLRSPPTAFIDINLTIYNPNDVTLTLRFFKLRYYFNGTLLNSEGFPAEESIPPNGRRTITVTSMIDLSSVSKQIEAVEEGKKTGNWNISGTAYFLSPSGKLIAPIKGIKLSVSRAPSLYSSKIIIEVKDEKWNWIEGANVTLISKEGNFSGLTNASGSVEFEVPTANYTIRVSKEGYITREESIELSAPSTVVRIIQLHPSKSGESPWWQQYWYAIAGIIALCIIPIVLRKRRKFR